MDISESRRWGLVLDILADMADVERQVVVQGVRPASFVPDELLDRWYDTFQGGHGMQQTGVSEDLLGVLLDFDYNLEDLMDIVPQDAPDRENYIRNDAAWRAIRELADWTLTRIIEASMPEQETFSTN